MCFNTYRTGCLPNVRIDQTRLPGAEARARWQGSVDRIAAAQNPDDFACGMVAIVTHLHNQLDRLGEHFRVALLVNPSSTEFGMARMQASLNDVLGFQTLIFYDEDEAVVWLVDGQPALQARAPQEGAPG